MTQDRYEYEYAEKEFNFTMAVSEEDEYKNLEKDIEENPYKLRREAAGGKIGYGLYKRKIYFHAAYRIREYFIHEDTPELIGLFITKKDAIDYIDHIGKEWELVPARERSR